MKKKLLSCIDCGDDTEILTQVSSAPEIKLLCSSCYNVKYSIELQAHVSCNKKNKK
ncbi:hypothetical protein VP91_00009770 [Candidatus Pelagibacter ubique]|mgnify:CR=1 FL=1|jgi:hypothetical protein|uniref:Uncharacterized protein n=1 Tax=Pelagibacter ubique TaxID=198252 RepID=A0ABX1T134_PELUQ|nr:hypothetical protein [Candidatus Pelagibacter ubique]NMN67828.1 hypothetical protein [Candidatus Pelagibacter ubique]